MGWTMPWESWSIFVPCEYDEIVKLTDNVTVRFTDVGHLLGSASIEVWMKEGIRRRRSCSPVT